MDQTGTFWDRGDRGEAGERPGRGPNDPGSREARKGAPRACRSECRALSPSPGQCGASARKLCVIQTQSPAPPPPPPFFLTSPPRVPVPIPQCTVSPEPTKEMRGLVLASLLACGAGFAPLRPRQVRPEPSPPSSSADDAAEGIAEGIADAGGGGRRDLPA